MSQYSDAILARYATIEREADVFGRVITVGRLKPAERQAVLKLADSDKLNVVGSAFVAGCVREIDDGGSKIAYRPPRTDADLAIVLNALEDEGMAAAMTAYGRLTDADKLEGKDASDAAKN